MPLSFQTEDLNIKNKAKFGLVFNVNFELATFSEEINGIREIDDTQYPFRMSKPKLFLLLFKKIIA